MSVDKQRRKSQQGDREGMVSEEGTPKEKRFSPKKRKTSRVKVLYMGEETSDLAVNQPL